MIDLMKSEVYIRKEHSLSAICQRFFETYASRPNGLVQLETIAGFLGVRKRRMYDIVNVLESVHVVQRKGKNEYVWLGSQNMNEALQNLKEEAQKWKHVLEKSAHLNREETRKGDPESSQQVSQESEDSGGKDKSRFSKGSESQVETGFILRTPPPPLPRNAYLNSESRRERSLRVLSEKFVQIFLLHEDEVIRWEYAVEAVLEIVCEGKTPESKSKAPNEVSAKARRLYDVANILTALHLLEKTTQTVSQYTSSKPAYKFLGAEGVEKYLASIAGKKMSGYFDIPTDWENCTSQTLLTQMKRKRMEEDIQANKENMGGHVPLAPRTIQFLPMVPANSSNFHEISPLNGGPMGGSWVQNDHRIPFQPLLDPTNFTSPYQMTPSETPFNTQEKPFTVHSTQCQMKPPEMRRMDFSHHGGAGNLEFPVQEKALIVQHSQSEDDHSVDSHTTQNNNKLKLGKCPTCGCTCQKKGDISTNEGKKGNEIGASNGEEFSPLAMLPNLFSPELLAKLQYQNPSFISYYLEYSKVLFQLYGKDNPRPPGIGNGQFHGQNGQVTKPTAIHIKEINELERVKRACNLGIGFSPYKKIDGKQK